MDAAGRNWSPEAYVSMDIRTTVSNTAHAAVDARCDAYGVDLIVIDSHTGARPKCALDQGKVYSRSNQSGIAHDGDGNEVPFYPLSSTSYGQPDGILGINCRHHKYPFIDGVNYQRYFPIDQEENAARYKEIQEQRRLERRIRETRREIDMLTAAGDKEGAAEAKIQLTERNKEYREYCDKHKLKQQYNRTRNVKSSDMGVTAPKIVDKGNSGVDKASESGIIKAKKSEWDNDLQPHGQLDISLESDDDKYEFVSKELNVPKAQAEQYVNSVSDFTGDWYPDIRAYQRGEFSNVPEEVVSKSEALEDYIKKAPRWNGGETFRGASVSDDEIGKYKQGFRLDMGGTASWSSDVDIAKEFSSRNVSYDLPNEVIYHCDTQSKGTTIKHLSLVEEESEILCSKDSHYVIDKIEGGYGTYHVYLKEVLEK